MKVFEYNGTKVITVENINEYITNDKSRETIKNDIPSWIGTEKYFKIPHPESVKYGQKKRFNYARGINLYPIDEILRILSEKKKYLEGKFDIDALTEDLSKGEVRELNAEEANKNWRLEKKKEKAKEKTALVKIKEDKEVEKPKQETALPISFDDVYALIDRMNENTIRVLTENNKVLSDRIDELSKKVDELTEIIKNKADEITKTESVFESPLILKENSTYEEWVRVVKRAIKLIIEKAPEKTESNILHEAYDRLRSQYGIVWEQEAKEFKEDCGRGPVNTRELCWWMENNKPSCKNLLIAKLNTMYSEVRRGVA